ncbi:hypothetical protein BDF14DRAFT_1746505 [Spinellus fusiger]|nr:hypothetical protein BDF14DRAFT_1746505 [Spinellus fusiger]
MAHKQVDYKELKARFATCGNVESIRFRSVAFAEPMPRKAAFITKRVHSDRETVNAYVVYATKEEAVKGLSLNGTLLFDKHLRVDSASGSKQFDRKRSVFIGSLPFDAQEEELWTFFKECGQIESVRIIRDSATNVGKGFGYVQFAERISVDSALSLEDQKFKGKKLLRIQRCKVSVSEGGIAPAPRKPTRSARGNGRPTRANGRPQRGKPVAAATQREGARASKDDNNKLKMKKKTTKNKK